MRQIVRNMSAATTHVADVRWTSAALSFGVPYRKPPTSTVTLCGVHVKDGVVMHRGTKIKCHACRYLDGKTGWPTIEEMVGVPDE